MYMLRLSCVARVESSPRGSLRWMVTFGPSKGTNCNRMTMRFLRFPNEFETPHRAGRELPIRVEDDNAKLAMLAASIAPRGQMVLMRPAWRVLLRSHGVRRTPAIAARK